jgi:probable HAF family extracellular repeat protein
MQGNSLTGRLVVVCALALLLAASTAFADRTRQYTVRELGRLAGIGGSARAINDRGEVAGASYLHDLPNVKQHAVAWNRRGVTDIGAGLGDQSVVNAMNDEGTMVGQVGVQPYIWAGDGRPTALPFAGDARAISDDGTIVGSFSTSGIFNFGPQHAYFFRHGVLHDLGTLNGGLSSAANDVDEHGVVVGSAVLPFSSDNRAVLWRNGAIRDLGGLGGHNSFAFRINDRGDIVGTAETADNRLMMVRWHVDGGMEVLGESLSPHAINARGAIVGNNLRTGKPFLWEDGAMTSLLDLPEMQAAGWQSFAPLAINEHGQIAGVAWKPGITPLGTALLLTPRS